MDACSLVLPPEQSTWKWHALWTPMPFCMFFIVSLLDVASQTSSALITERTSLEPRPSWPFASRTGQEIKWIFNPPGASHMGGVWERQIHTMRTILHALLQQQQVDDDTLNTIFCMAENIVNGRPITKLSDDPSDDTLLMLNHLLLLRSGPVCPPCVTSKQDLYRRCWRQAQYLADVFWTSWVREYLPFLQACQKWMKPQRNIAVGDLVLVQHENTPHHQ